MNATKRKDADSEIRLTPAAKRERGGRLIVEGNRLIAEATFEELATNLDTFNQNTSPLTKRQFLDAARAGKFPTTKIQNLVTAKRVDVFAYMEREGIKRGRHTDTESLDDVIEDILKAGGGRR